MTEWGTGHEPDPDELVDFMTTEGCGPVRVPHIEPHPVPLHEAEDGVMDEEVLLNTRLITMIASQRLRAL